MCGNRHVASHTIGRETVSEHVARLEGMKHGLMVVGVAAVGELHSGCSVPRHTDEPRVAAQLMKALEKVDPDVVPVSFIQELKDLLQTYMNNGAADQSFVVSLNKLLLRYNSKPVLHGTSQKLPANLGVVTIVEDEATSQVRSSGKQTQVNIQGWVTQQVLGSTQQADSANAKIAKASTQQTGPCKGKCSN